MRILRKIRKMRLSLSFLCQFPYFVTSANVISQEDVSAICVHVSVELLLSLHCTFSCFSCTCNLTSNAFHVWLKISCRREKTCCMVAERGFLSHGASQITHHGLQYAIEQIRILTFAGKTANASEAAAAATTTAPATTNSRLSLANAQ